MTLLEFKKLVRNLKKSQLEESFFKILKMDLTQNKKEYLLYNVLYPQFKRKKYSNFFAYLDFTFNNDLEKIIKNT